MNLSDQPVAVAEIAVNGGTVVNTAATAVAVHQSTQTDDLRDTDNKWRRSYQCTVCLKEFTQKGNLIVHIRTHTGERPYQCDRCQKTFTQKSNLTVHLRTHTGERPFQCTVCPKAYTSSTGLQYHRQRAHPPPNPLSQLNQSQ